MRLEVKHRPGGDQLYIVHRERGRRRRTYVRKSNAAQVVEKFQSTRKVEPPPKPPDPPKRRGRPRVIPSVLKEIANLAGFSTLGILVSMNRRNFLTLEAARIRFQLLDDGDQAFFQSAERLHDVSVQANSRMKSKNRRRIPTSFAECFDESLRAAGSWTSDPHPENA